MSRKSIRPITRDDAEVIMGELAYASHSRDKQTAAMNIKLTAVRDQFEPSIASLTKIIAQKEKELHAFADANPETFGKSRSLKMVHGIVGYRLGNFALKTIRGITWNRALALVKELAPGFVRTKEEIDKDAILAARNAIRPIDFTRMGLRVEQAEKFYAEPIKDTTKD